MKKYIVYYEDTNLPVGDRCGHHIDEFGELFPAYQHKEKVMAKGLYKNVFILKNIAVKVEVEEVKDEEPRDDY